MLKQKPILEWFMRKQNLSLFLQLDKQGGVPIQRLAMRVKVTYSHAVQIYNLLQKKKLVKIEKNGRANSVKITEKGEEMQRHLFILKQLLE